MSTSIPEENKEKVDEDGEIEHSNSSDELDSLREDMVLNTITFPGGIRKIQFWSQHEPGIFASDDYVDAFISTIDVEPDDGEYRPLVLTKKFSHQFLCYQHEREQHLFEPQYMTNNFHIKVADIVVLVALMNDSNMIRSLKGVGVPEDILTKFGSLQKEVGKCITVGIPEEVFVSNFDSLKSKVTYVHHSFDPFGALVLAQAIAVYRYKVKDSQGNIYEEEKNRNNAIYSFNAKAIERSNIILHWRVHKFFLVFFFSIPR